MTIKDYVELLIKNNFNTNKVTDDLKKTSSTLSYQECYSMVMNYYNIYATKEEKNKIENAIEIWNKEKENNKKKSKEIYLKIKEGVALKELNNKYNIDTTQTIELYYQYIWNTIKKKKDITELNKKEELILSKYLFYIFINNNKDITTFVYNNVYNNDESEEKITNYLNDILDNYLNTPIDNKVTTNERNILNEMNYKFNPHKLVSLQELKNQYKKEEKEYNEIITDKISSIYKDQTPIPQITNKMLISYLKNNNQTEIEKLKEYLQYKAQNQKYQKNKYDNPDNLLKKINNITEEQLKPTYLEIKVLENPQILLSISKEDRLELLQEFTNTTLKKIEENTNKFDYYANKIQKTLNLLPEKRKEEIKTINENTQESKRENIIGKLNIEAVKILKKVINYINNKEVENNVQQYLKEEDFTLLDYYAITDIDLEKLYNLSYEYYRHIDTEDKYTIKKDLETFAIWIKEKGGFDFRRSRGFIKRMDTYYLNEEDLEKNKIIMQGREITKEEKEKITNFLIKNNIKQYEKIYKIAIKRYLDGTLEERYHTFSKYKKKLTQ